MFKLVCEFNAISSQECLSVPKEKDQRMENGMFKIRTKLTSQKNALWSVYSGFIWRLWSWRVCIRVPLISQNVTEGLHNGFLGAILCQSQPKKNSDFYLHFWPLAPHFGGAVGANGKTAQKWLKKYQIFKLAENPFKSWKSLKPNAIPIFLGDVGLIKVVSKFSFGHP